MHSLCRPLLRTLAPRNTPLSFLAKPSPICVGLGRKPILIRNIASSVTNQPGSQSLEHAATNVKEEIGNSTKDLAKVIAGANVTTDAVSDSSADSFVCLWVLIFFFPLKTLLQIGITTSIASQVPQPLMVLGLSGVWHTLIHLCRPIGCLGGLPYISASLTTIYAAHKANIAATAGIAAGIDPNVALTVLHQALSFQVTYGAVMLSFLGMYCFAEVVSACSFPPLGALHWGMEIAGYGGQKGYARLGLGAAPMLVSWSTLAMEPMSALIVQWVGYTGLWYADSKATIAGWGKFNNSAYASPSTDAG